MEKKRFLLPAVEERLYFNTGTAGPLPLPTLQAMEQALQEDAWRGRIGSSRMAKVFGLLADTRKTIAAFFGADPDEVAFTSRCTDGLNIVLWGLRWSQGDEIITTTHEHPGLLVPLVRLHQARGVVIRYVDPGGEAEGFLRRLEAAFSSRTRLVALSHVLWTRGMTLPLKAVVDLAHRHGAGVLVDGAQSAGVLPLDFRTSGVDYYAIPGQKWLLGPEGTGILLIRKDRLEEVGLTYGGYPSQKEVAPDRPEMVLKDGAQRYETGLPLPAAVVGLKSSLEFLHAISMDAIAAEVRRLVEKAYGLLREVPGLTLLTPPFEGGYEPSGLLTFRLEGWEDAEVVKALEQKGIIVRSLPRPFGGVRVSVHFFNTDEELEKLAGALANLHI
ncbi:MAG: aminotransferase class V-fold PLP-dependent enzyme [Clostridiales bacterium]|nr:aminotransferase class V-fold PLP-dependent enzyme [Clostridiales bacterium]